jgi:hypothetical protein
MATCPDAAPEGVSLVSRARRCLSRRETGRSRRRQARPGRKVGSSSSRLRVRRRLPLGADRSIYRPALRTVKKMHALRRARGCVTDSAADTGKRCCPRISRIDTNESMRRSVVSSFVQIRGIRGQIFFERCPPSRTVARGVVSAYRTCAVTEDGAASALRAVHFTNV